MTLSIPGQTAAAVTTARAQLLMVGPYQPDLRIPTERQHSAYAAAAEVVRDHPSDFAPVWIDKSTDELHLKPLTAAGRRLLAVLQSSSDVSVPMATTAASTSQQTLTDLMDALADLSRSGIVGSDEILETEVDAQLGRAVVTVKSFSAPLADYISANFPTDLVAMRVDPNADTGAAPGESRATDVVPYAGGAQIGLIQPNGGTEACTTGVPWKDANYVYLLTAGHCAPSGSSRVYSDATGSPTVGTITSGTRENWTPGVGTVAFVGQTMLRGDFGLIRVSSLAAADVEPYVFRGGAGSAGTTRTKVYGWNTSVPQVGDQLCTDGRMTGELCGWVIYKVQYNEDYGAQGVVHHVSSAKKLGTCTIPGDSGSPLYTVNSSGAYMRGLYSGQGGGGSDHYGGAADPCWVYYSEIYDAYLQLPGAPYVG